jgi:hypothetical protein
MAEVSWHCVGLIKVGEGSVKVISLDNGGNKIATVSSITAFDDMIVNLVDGNFILKDMTSPLGRVIAWD